MPTGVEEVLAAIAASIASAVGTAATTGALLPGSTPDVARVEAADAAHGARDPFMAPELVEGAPAGPAAPAPDATGTAQQPVTGDRPPPSATYGAPMAGNPDEGRGRVFEFEPALVTADARPAPQAAPSGAAADQRPDRAADPLPPPPSPQSWPGESPAVAPGAPSGAQPVAPPAGEPEPPGVDPALPDSTRPLSDPPSTGSIGVPADWADWMEREVPSFSRAIFGESGEELGDRVKGRVGDRVGDWLLEDDDLDDSEITRNVKVLAAVAAKTTADMVVDAVVVPLLDPASIVRGPLRLGTATPTGLRQIEEGETLLGVTTIVGEGSSVILMVAGGKASVARVTKPKGRVTLYTEKRVGGHSVVEVKIGDEVHRSHVMPDEEGMGYAQALEYFYNKDLGGGRRVRTPVTPDSKYVPATRNVSEPAARRMIAAMLDAETLKTDLPFPGSRGPYGYVLGETCSTYTASILSQGGIFAVGRLGAHFNALVFTQGARMSTVAGMTLGPDAPREAPVSSPP